MLQLVLLVRMIASLLILSTSCLLIHASSGASPLCTGSRAPLVLGESTLSFCGYSGISCCDAIDDAALREQFEAINISHPACAAAVKSILCAECSTSSAEIFDTTGSTSKTRSIPLLCSSTPSSSFPHHTQPNDDNYCQLVWQTCKDAAMVNSRRFQPLRPLQAASIPSTNDTTQPRSPSSSTKTSSSTKMKLTDFWRSETDFCSSFGSSSSSSACFNGKGVSLLSHSTTRSLQPWRPSPQVLCLERIGAGSYLAMAAHPDGSGRVFLSSQDGKIWLASVPEHGFGGTLDLDVSPFLDISDRIHFDARLGLMVLGVAFHPEFATNGRFFVSYICDSAWSPTYGASRCDPAKLGAAANGTRPCPYQLVVSEFSVKRGVSKEMTVADPSEVRRIFTMGLPYASHNHGGQILFRPTDGYLYLITGHGRQKEDRFDFSQDKRSFLGKIVRLDINHTPGQSEISNRSKPVIFAMGLSNPRGCSFDSNKPSYFYCGDVAKYLYEEVHLISKGGNYGGSSVKGADSPIITHGRPAAGRPPSIVGGLVYRGSVDPSLEGRYLYTYGSAMWAGMETPEGSGRYASTRIPLAKCSRSSPMPCRGGAIPRHILSFGEDNRKDAFVLATGGVYRVVWPDLCGGYGGARPIVKPAVAGATVGNTNGVLLPAESSLPWKTGLLYFGGIGLFLAWAWRAYWKEITNGGNEQATTYGNFCNCCNTVMCCVTNYWGMLNRN